MPKAKLRGCTDSRGDYSMVWIWCPGCDEHHAMPVTKPSNGDGVAWAFNGDEERPTITPSILVSSTSPKDGKIYTKCHSFVTDGKIQFLSDSAHALAGQTVELPEVDM